MSERDIEKTYSNKEFVEKLEGTKSAKKLQEVFTKLKISKK